MIGDFLKKFHLSLVAAGVTGTSVDRMKNRKANEILIESQ